MCPLLAWPLSRSEHWVWHHSLASLPVLCVHQLVSRWCVCVSLLLIVPAEEFDESVVPALPKAKLAPTRGAAYKVLATLCGGTPDNLASLMQRLSSLVAQTTKVGLLSRALPRSAMTLVWGGGGLFAHVCHSTSLCVGATAR
jgi:hypothetical protein